MKVINHFLLFFCIVLTIACTNDSTQPATVATDLDLTGFESKEMPGGIIRLLKKDPNGQVIEEGYLKDGKKNGVWTTLTDDRTESITSYVDGIKYGKSFKIDHRLQISEEETYVNGQLYGKAGRYKRGRPLEEGYYVNGKRQGAHKLYFESGADQGKIRQYTEYVNGKIHGKLRMYNASGAVTVEYDYKNGEKVGGGIVK